MESVVEPLVAIELGVLVRGWSVGMPALEVDDESCVRAIGRWVRHPGWCDM